MERFGGGVPFLIGVGRRMCPGAALSVARGLRPVVGRDHVRLVIAPECLRLLRRQIDAIYSASS